MCERELRKGFITVKLTINEQDIVSNSPPPQPLFRKIFRSSYLLCEEDVIYEHFGDATVDARRCIWFEDTRSQRPLASHLPIGVLFDANGQDRKLPWHLNVHFQRFPRQVIPFEDSEALKRHFLHSLKQALYLESGSAQAAMSLSKSDQDSTWESLNSNVEVKLLSYSGATKCIPVRIFEEGQNMVTLRIPLSADKTWTVGSLLEEHLDGPRPMGEDYRVVIQGLLVDKDMDLCWLWTQLRHADRFLYLAVF